MTTTFLHGDCRDVLKTLPDKHFYCCVTSPPYYGLRDYGVEGQVGLEPTPDCAGWASGAACGECYVCHLLGVFREVRRVLRDDGTVWLNLGDSYATSNPVGRRDTVGTGFRPGRSAPEGSFSVNARRRAGLADKQLLMIPARVALALQADGWFVRQDIIWSKPNPMPESATDRCTRSHEYIFLLSKMPNYHFDATAIREASSESSLLRSHISRVVSPKHALTDASENRAANMDRGQYGQGRNKRSVWEVALKPFKDSHFAVFPPELITPCILAGCPVGGAVLDPFMGAGTTGVVAATHDRDFTGIELNTEYMAISQRRIKSVTDQGSLFAASRASCDMTGRDRQDYQSCLPLPLMQTHGMDGCDGLE